MPPTTSYGAGRGHLLLPDGLQATPRCDRQPTLDHPNSGPRTTPDHSGNDERTYVSVGPLSAMS